MRLYPSSLFTHATLKDCGEIVTGSTPSKSNAEFWGGKVPFVTPAQLGFRDPITTANEFVTMDGAERGRMLPEGAVLVCCIGSLGKTGVAGVPLITNQQINAIIFDPNQVEARYGYYAARKLTHLLEHFAPSTTVKIIKKSSFAKMEIPLPPLTEQKRIAKILDATDALRAKRREALAQLDTLLQSTFIDMFGDPVINPMGWEQCTIGDVVHSAKDGPHVSPKYSETGIPFLSTRHIKPGEVIWEDLKFIDQEEANRQWKKCKPELGDILYTKGGTTGIAARVTMSQPFAIWVHVALLKPIIEKVNPAWLEAMLNSAYCYTQSQRYTHGIANRDLGLKRMVKIKSYLPPLTLQTQFATIVKSIEQQKARMQAHLTELDTLFASLQQRAFNGEL